MNSDPHQHILFTTWKDKGENIGIQCHICKRTFWTDHESVGRVPVDPAKPELGEKDCENCIAIRQTSLLVNENRLHKQNHLIQEGQEKPLKECGHQPSQP